MIKHVVLSGAGVNGLVQLGILKEFLRQGLVLKEKLESVYGTSAGAILLYMFLLDIPITALEDYFISRPWDKVFKPDIPGFAKTKGLLPTATIQEIFVPFLYAYDIPLTLTFAELYERTKITFHVFVTELENLDSVILNHKTYPNMEIVQALNISSSLPPVFPPVKFDGAYYLDGGMSNNFPIQKCLDDGADPESVLAVQMCGIKHPSQTAIEFTKAVIAKLVDRVMLTDVNTRAGNTCKYFINYQARGLVDPDLWIDFMASSTKRREMIDEGELFASKFLDLKLKTSICA